MTPQIIDHGGVVLHHVPEHISTARAIFFAIGLLVLFYLVKRK